MGSNLAARSTCALALLGPTAIGKTALAMALADKLPVRIISVDSAMVFRHLNIGTAKPTQSELAAYPHELVDLIEPTENYSAAAFLRDAQVAVEAAWQADELPVFVGGTMLYFRALREGLAEMPDRDPVVRDGIEAELADRGVAVMHKELERIDPVAAAGMDANNHQRLVRALEVFRLTGTPISQFWASDQQGFVTRLGGKLLEHALVPRERARLHDRINQRFEQMLDEGFVTEVAGLYTRGDLTADHTSMRCVGYRQVWPHVAGDCTLDQARLTGQAATRQLAKRQLTWLRGWHRAGLLQQWVCDDDPRLHVDALLANLQVAL